MKYRAETFFAGSLTISLSPRNSQNKLLEPPPPNRNVAERASDVKSDKAHPQSRVTRRRRRRGGVKDLQGALDSQASQRRINSKGKHRRTRFESDNDFLYSSPPPPPLPSAPTHPSPSGITTKSKHPPCSFSGFPSFIARTAGRRNDHAITGEERPNINKAQQQQAQLPNGHLGRLAQQETKMSIPSPKHGNPPLLEIRERCVRPPSQKYSFVFNCAGKKCAPAVRVISFLACSCRAPMQRENRRRQDRLIWFRLRSPSLR